MPETVIPAPTPEAVRAAVQNGADAVYIALGSFGDRAFAEAVKYCRIRGVKIYFALPPAVRDGEADTILKKARRAAELGAAAIETGDLGMLQTLHRMLPDTPIHFRGGAVNAAGIATAAYLGATRVTLSPDLTLEEIRELCRLPRVELELPCHGPACTAAGICRMSALSGTGCACFGDCAMNCRTPLGASSRRGDFYLSRKDICLADDIPDLLTAGIAALRVLGSDRRPEYSALTARIYSAAAAGKSFDREDLDLLEDAFAPGGMAIGFFREGSSHMLGRQDDRPRYPQTVLGDVRDAYMQDEADLVPVSLKGSIFRGEPVKISVSDDRGNSVTAEGLIPGEALGGEETGSVQLRTSLHNLVGTPFYCTEAEVEVSRGLYVPTAQLIALRKKALDELARKRAEFPPPRVTAPDAPDLPGGSLIPPDINIYVRRAAQLSPQLAGLKPEILYIPVTELLENPGSITPFWENGVTTICAALPPILHDGRDAELMEQLERLRELQVNDILVSEPGQILPAAARGFTVRADSSIGAYNSRTLGVLRDLRVSSVTLPPELKLSEIRELAKAVPAELIVYGRVTLMSCELDLSAAAGTELLRGRRSTYPIFREYNGRSSLLSSGKLFLSPGRKDYETAGLWCGRLDFTTESPEECVLITQRFLGQNKHTPAGTVKGLYY